MNKTNSVLLCIIFLCLNIFAGSTSPSQCETYMLELVNRLRNSPDEETEKILSSGLIPDFVDVELFKKEMEKFKNSQPLFFDRRMIDAARKHNKYQLIYGQGHIQKPGNENFTGVTVKERLFEAGMKVQLLSSGENAFTFAQSPWHGQIAFIVDWGKKGPGGMQIDRGHRRNLLSQNYNLAGIGITDNGKYKAITQTFASATGRYAGGVAYDDKNRNSIYDPGEGINGIEIIYKDKSIMNWDNGAFTMPIDEEGGRIIFKWKDRYEAHFINAGTRNIKCDFIKHKSSQKQVSYADIYLRDFKKIDMDVSTYFKKFKDEILNNNIEFSTALKSFKDLRKNQELTEIDRQKAGLIYKTLSDKLKREIVYLNKTIIIKPIGSLEKFIRLKQLSKANYGVYTRVINILEKYKTSPEYKMAEILADKETLTRKQLIKKLKPFLQSKLAIETKSELNQILDKLN